MRLATTAADIVLSERARWFLWLPVLLGIGIAFYFSLQAEPPLWLLVLSPLTLAVVLGARHTAWLPVLLAMLAISSGFNAAQINTYIRSAPQLNRPVFNTVIEGRVRGVDAAEGGARLLLDQLTIEHLDAAQTPGQVRVKLTDPAMAWPDVGAKVRLTEVTINPLSEPVAPHAYDFRRHGFFEGLGGIGWTRGTLEVIEAAPKATFAPGLYAEELRATISKRVGEQLTGDTAAITAALLNGEQTGISEPTKLAMRASGLQHILSISGLHIGLVAGLSFFLIRLLFVLIPYTALRWPAKKIAAIGGFLVALAYTWLVGAPVPTVRAAVMTAIIFLAVLVDRRAVTLRLVAVAAIVILLIAPHALLSASFQMSFAAVTVMVAAYERAGNLSTALRGHWWGQALLYMGGIAATSLLATIATTPFTLYHFQQFTVYGVIANMLAVPLTGFVIMPAALAVYVFLPMGLEHYPLALMGWGVDGLIAIARAVAAWPGAMIRLPAAPLAALLLTVAGGLWFLLWQRNWRWLGCAGIALGVWLGLRATPPDMLIHNGGTIWAVRSDENHWVFAGAKANNFVIEQWQQLLGMPAFASVYDARKQDGTPFDCQRTNCLFWQDVKPVAFVRDAVYLKDLCADAGFVVTPLPAACRQTMVIGRNELSAHGAHAVNFGEENETVITSARAARGLRPWSEGYRQQSDFKQAGQ